jgi:hypothetical protein
MTVATSFVLGNQHPPYWNGGENSEAKTRFCAIQRGQVLFWGVRLKAFDVFRFEVARFVRRTCALQEKGPAACAREAPGAPETWRKPAPFSNLAL